MSGREVGPTSWASDGRRVRVLTVTTWADDAAEAVDVVRTRSCAPALGWWDLVEHVTGWALRHGCEVESIARCADSDAACLRVFSPDGRMAWEWVEPREVCAECGTLAPLVQRASGHVETACACSVGHDCGAVTVDPYVEVCTECGRVIGGAR